MHVTKRIHKPARMGLAKQTPHGCSGGCAGDLAPKDLDGTSGFTGHCFVWQIQGK